MPRDYHDHSGDRHTSDQRYDEREKQLTDADYLALFEDDEPKVCDECGSTYIGGSSHVPPLCSNCEEIIDALDWGVEEA